MHKSASGIATEIEFWTFPNFTSESGVEGDFEKGLIAAFERENPSVKVHFTLLTYADGQEKIEKAIAEGKVPDIIYDAPGRIIGWAEKGLLEPLDDVLATEKPYITTVLLAISAGKDRRTYMYPMHEGAFSMAFNKEMLEDLGLIDLLPYKRRDRQWTVAEYERLLTALKEKLPAEKTGAPICTRCTKALFRWLSTKKCWKTSVLSTYSRISAGIVSGRLRNTKGC